MADLDLESFSTELGNPSPSAMFSNPPQPTSSLSSPAQELSLLRQIALLKWVNNQISHPVATLSDLADGSAIVTLVACLSGQAAGLEREESSWADTLKQWSGVPELPFRVSQAPFDADQITRLLGFIHAHYQARTIRSLQGNPSVHIFDSQRPAASPAEVPHALLSWAQTILQDYTSDAFLDPIHDFTSSWRDGLHFLAMLHYFDSSLVPDLDSHVVAKQPHHTLSVAFQLAEDAFHIPRLLDVQELVEAPFSDALAIQAYLIEVAKATSRLDPSPLERRLADIERWKMTLHAPQVDYSIPISPSPSSVAGSDAGEDLPPNAATTRTSKYTLQNVRITKSTHYKHPDGTDVPVELEKFEQSATSLLDKVAALHHRFQLVAPTRSSNYHAPVPSSATPEDRYTPSEDATDAVSLRSGGSESEGIVHALHPLTSAEQDLMAYKVNFKALEAALHSLHDDDLANLRHYVLVDLDPQLRNEPKVLERMERIDEAFDNLSEQAKQEGQKLAVFCRGFSFAQMCATIRGELELVQTKMVKSTTTDPDIQDLEMRVEKTSAMTEELKSNFSDLLDDATKDEAYKSRLDDVVKKNDLVRTWVEEVRVWFAEAERIRQWIMIRHERLGETTLPEPLASDALPAEREQVDAWNASHTILDQEIKQFDEEDMARLRSHVKSLTSADRIGKDLSPADTTTIEITLTTLSALDKLMYALRLKSDRLQMLTLRVMWEYEYTTTLSWIQSTNKDVDAFLCNDARWLVSEDDSSRDTEDAAQQLATKGNLNETAVQRLLELEHKISEFEQGQYSNTLDTFQDLDDTTNDAVPDFLELRQTQCEDLFSNLRKRMEFARNVVEQRLSIVSFLQQTKLVKEDAQQLLSDLKDGKVAAYKWDYEDAADNGAVMTERVHDVREAVIQLVKVTGNQVPYPIPKLDVDVEENTSSNAIIRKVIEIKQSELNALSRELDERLWALKNVLQLHHDARVLTDDATRLSEWAEDRIRQVKNAKLGTDTLTIDDLKQSERERNSLMSKLSNGKNNDVSDLVKRFDAMLERTEESLDTPSVDSADLADIAQHLSKASQHLTSTFDRLKQSLDEQQQDLQMLRKKMEDGHSYFETANALRTFISETLTSMPGLKQTNGFMTGQSQEKDQQRLDMLNSALDHLSANFNERQRQYEQICTRFHQMEPGQIDDMATVHRFQQALEQDWAKLSHEMEALKQFRDTVNLWHERHQRLNLVEHTLLAGLDNAIERMTQTGWSDADLAAIESRLDTAVQTLEFTGKEITAADTKEDPLQTANYSCARDRHLTLSTTAQTSQSKLTTLKSHAMELLKQQKQSKATATDPPSQKVEIARKIKEIMTMIGDLKGRAALVRICSRNTKLDDDPIADLKAILSCPLSFMPTERQSLAAEAKLDALERDIDQHLNATTRDLDEMLAANEENTDLFAGQRVEISDSVRGLTVLMKAKRDAIAEAAKLEPFLTVTEELEVLLSALTEVVDRASPELARSMFDGAPSRADLQAMLIDLDTRYQYYDPKIEELMQEAKDTGKQHVSDRRVAECLAELEKRWAELKALAALKKKELRARIGPPGDTFMPSNTLTHLKDRGRKAMSMIVPAGQRPQTPSDGRPPRPQSMQSTPRLMSATNGGRAGARPAPRVRTTTGNVSPTARRVAAVRAVAAQRLRESTTTPEAYVADPKNDLDVALGDIVNDSPYKVAVKMVPGEVGKYWFGNGSPKLAYCRILRSRMVMVRVGGGWVELSQFLRDHALLSSGNIVTRAAQPNMGPIQEGCLRTYATNGMVTIRGGGVGRGGAGGAVGDAGGRRSPLLCESKSTPFNRGVSPIFGHGVKEGNKFVVTLDGQGNQVEVKMTKAKNKDTSKFFTPRWTHAS